jgi:hypothetical protein
MPFGKHAQVLAAVPVGFRAARTVRAGERWLSRLTSSPAFAGCRGDFRETVRRVAEFLSVARRYEHGLIRPGLDAVCAAVPDRCRRTVQRALCWLRARSWIAHVQRGSTERYRGAADGPARRALRRADATAAPVRRGT